MSILLTKSVLFRVLFKLGFPLDSAFDIDAEHLCFLDQAMSQDGDVLAMIKVEYSVLHFAVT